MTAHLRYTGWEGCLERGNSVLELPHPCPQTAAAAMATLYPSLEDMKGHQVLQVSASSAVLQGVSRLQWVPVESHLRGSPGWGAQH